MSEHSISKSQIMMKAMVCVTDVSYTFAVLAASVAKQPIRMKHIKCSVCDIINHQGKRRMFIEHHSGPEGLD